MSEYNIYIGTEPRMWLGLEVLKYSIHKYASKPVNIIEMNYENGGYWEGWDMGREIGEPAKRGYNAKTGSAVWFTDFSNFRWAIPEVNNFEGRAIYLDFDEIVKGDIIELFEFDMKDKPVLSLTPNETSVMLMDCSKFNNDWFPKIDQMKTNGWSIRQYIQLLVNNDYFGNIPTRWNCLDGQFWGDDYTKLVHYTAMNTQPHRPYPDKLRYRRHPVPHMETIWFEEFYEMVENGLLDMDAVFKETAFLEFEKQFATEHGLKSICHEK